MRKPNAITLGLAAIALADCYNTNGLTNGGLVCSADGSCPTGYTCQIDQGIGSAGHCWKNGTYRADAGNQDVSSPISDASPAACMAATPPFGPLAGCESQAVPNSTCDPVCQSGCPCYHRCVINEQTNTTFQCEETAQSATAAFVAPMHSCAADTSRCAPGSVCVADDTCGHLCYRTCRVNQDCGSSSRCTASSIVDSNNQPVKNVYFCSPPIETCSPVGAATCNSGISGFKCVFLSGLTTGNTDAATVCDCSSQHTKAVGQKCTSLPDDCQAGSVCVGTGQTATCHSVCSLLAPGGCPGTSACTPIYGSTTYGYCR
jgi:hypothetical protein